MCLKSQADTETQWPVAAASRIRVCISGDNQQLCRLFYNESNHTIELVPTTDEFNERQVYDDADTGIKDESTYKSYIISMKDDTRRIVDSFHLDDVIGINLSLEYNTQNPNTFHGMQRYSSNASINVYAYPKMKRGKICNEGKRTPCHKKYSIDSRGCEDFADVRKLINAIRKVACLQINLPIDNRPIRYLVVMNVFSGDGGLTSKRGSKHIYETMLNPMLEQAGIEYDVLVTRRGGHAKDRMEFRRSQEAAANSNETLQLDDKLCSLNTDTEIKDIAEYNAIVALGGDGIMFEIMQGIRARRDEKEILKTMKFGLVGCGTNNGLVKSILHWSGENYGPLESIFHICKGSTSPLDIASYQLANSLKTYTSFLTFSWGLIADCDLESECLRWLGSLRQDIWAVYRGILFPKRYRARFSYLPAKFEGNGKAEAVTLMPEFEKPVDKEWVTIEDDFKLFWASNVSHAASNMYLCPMAKMDDGMFHILIVRSSCSRIRMLELLLKLESGKHIQCKDAEVVDCVAYRLEPLTDNSYNDLDGELIEPGPIQACVMPYGAQFFAGKKRSDDLI